MTINHPGMTPQWFDEAVHRACCNGCRVLATGKPGVLFVTSSSQAGVTYRVTRRDCTCQGQRHAGQCQHRALAIAWADVFRPAERSSAATRSVA